MIPGLKPTLDVRAKVRIGEKRTSQKGNAYPAAVDYFISDDAEFAQLVGERKSAIRIQLPHATTAENFSTGMEWWRGKQLSCYSKGETVPSGAIKAYRIIAVLDGDDVKLGDPMGRGNERQPIMCRFRECKHFGKHADNKECRVMGRLVFFLDGGRTDSVLEVDTKAWNTIEALTGALTGMERSGPLNAPGRVFELTVRMVQQGRDKFPVLDITEANVVINSEQDAVLADELLKLDATLSAEGLADRERSIKVQLCVCLDLSNPGWREREDIIAKLKEQGGEAAAKSYLQRQLG